MLNHDGAMTKLEELARACQPQRLSYDAFWALAKVYDHGSQWGYINRVSGRNELKFLRGITDPRRTDIRVAQNKIHPVVTRLKAASAPEQIAYDAVARSAAEHGWGINAKKLLDAHLDDIGALQILREKEDFRYVLGTVIVRRTLAMQGASNNGDPRGLRAVRPGWAVIQPHEILRDPTANTLYPHRDEAIFCHEKPQTADWIKRNFQTTIKPSTTMGQLMGYQRAMQSATGLAADRGVTESKVPAVLVYECYYQDPDSDLDWPWVQFAYVDSGPDAGRKFVPLGKLRPNPFYGLPFHFFNYDTELQAPWARGVPHVAMQGQDIFNICLTWLMRWMQEGSGRWMVPKQAIDETKQAEILTNRIDTPLFYNPTASGAKPERTRPPEINAATMEMLANAPEWIKEAVSLSDVQFGKPAGKRGESGQALELRLGEANAPLEKLRRDDELTMEELLYGTMADLVNPRHTHLARARMLLGKDADDEQVRALFRSSPVEQIKKVQMHPSTVRPTTPGEKKSEFTTLIGQNVLDPVEGQWEMMLRGVSVNTGMKNNFDKQVIEIGLMQRGKPVVVEMFEDHDNHIRAIEWYFSRPDSMHIEDRHRVAILQHAAAHVQAKITRAMGEGAIPQAPQQSQPSPPATAMGGMAQTAGPAQPAAVA